MKKVCKFCLTIIILLLMTLSVNAEDISKVVLNGNTIQFSNSPFLKDGYTLVPLREFAEKAGWEVWWENPKIRVVKDIPAPPRAPEITCVITMADILEFEIDETSALLMNPLKGEIKKESPVATELINNKAFVPLRFLCESFGQIVKSEETAEGCNIYIDDKKINE